MTTASETIAGNRIEMELDNEKARGWLQSSIEASAAARPPAGLHGARR
jgi:hypothetical protein